MAPLFRFLLYNLSASLLAGVLAWLLVMGALRLLQVRSPFLHASFMALPLLKSLLVLAGMNLIFPWPANWFGVLHLRAVRPMDALPFILVWFGLVAAVYSFLSWQARQKMLRRTIPPTGELESRLQAALQRVVTAYEQTPCCRSGEVLCCLSDRIPSTPRLLVSAQLHSPVALVEGGSPVVIFPQALPAGLDDDELALALAHELNHFALRQPVWRSSGILRLMTLVSPIAFLLADYYHRQEEQACDDLAVTILKQPEVYAGMLLKSYQFARQRQSRGWPKSAPSLPGLLGAKSFFPSRVERLLNPAPAGRSWTRFPAITWFVWAVLVYFLFLAQLGA